MTGLSALGPIRLMGLLQRKEGLTQEQFRAHWRGPHKVEAEKLARFMIAYIQNHGVGEPVPGLPDACAGVPEIWFETPEQIAAMTASDDYMTGAYIDEPRFMEGRSDGLVMVDRVITSGPVAMPDEAMVRVNLYITHTGDRTSFDAAMNASDLPIFALKVAPARHMRGLCIVPPEAPPTYAANEVYWFEDMAAFKAAWSPEITGTYTGVVDRAGCRGLLTHEERVFWPKDGLDYSG